MTATISRIPVTAETLPRVTTKARMPNDRLHELCAKEAREGLSLAEHDELGGIFAALNEGAER